MGGCAKFHVDRAQTIDEFCRVAALLPSRPSSPQTVTRTLKMDLEAVSPSSLRSRTPSEYGDELQVAQKRRRLSPPLASAAEAAGADVLHARHSFDDGEDDSDGCQTSPRESESPPTSTCPQETIKTESLDRWAEFELRELSDAASGAISFTATNTASSRRPG